MPNEADTCRLYVVPKLQQAGWDDDPHSITEQRYFTDGRIVPAGAGAVRKKGKKADYLLRYTRDFPIAVVEAKADYRTAGAGMGQAKDYADILGLKFAYSTNGTGIVEFDFITGRERELAEFPKPAELWARLRAAEGLQDESVAKKVLTPSYNLGRKAPRYYQEIAINRVVQAVMKGQQRILLTMATGTGKTTTAFQICWKLWNSMWNRTGEHRKPRILFLADRNILVDDPKDKDFAPFGAARWKIEGGVVNQSRQMYFAIYQAIAKDEKRPGLYKEFARDFFDFIVIDECHRGSSRDESNWREILEYFEPAFQLGMTATPLREDNRDTYDYFGRPIYTYSLRQGIDDGFLAPYRVHRIVTNWDAAGWRPTQGQVDRHGQAIPDREYHTADFERVLAMRARTQAIAKHLSNFLKRTDRYGKTIVFCVDQEHADEMRRALNNENADLAQKHSDYVCRVTAEDGDIGRGHLSRFQDVETDIPVILTTSQLLTTGVDAPTCRNVVIARVVNSMTEFKQIIGRGTRVNEEHKKFFFNILDYTGSATKLFADSAFDGDPVKVTKVEIDKDGSEKTVEVEQDEAPAEQLPGEVPVIVDADPTRRKLYVDGGQVEIAAHMVYELDENGHQLRVVQLTDFTAEKVRMLCPTQAAFRAQWADPEKRQVIVDQLSERGIDFDALAEAMNFPGADPFDLLCHVAYHLPVRSRRERAELLKRDGRVFFERYKPEARAILNDLLEKYAEHGEAQFQVPDVLKVPPLSQRGNPMEIASLFGGPEKLRRAVNELQSLLYSN